MHSEDTVKFFVSKLIKEYANRKALTFIKEFRKEDWTYKEIYDYANRIANFLKKQGIKKKDKIAIYCYNCPDWGALFIACAISGIILVPLDFSSNPTFVKKIVTKTKTKKVFCSKFRNPGLKNQIQIENLRDLTKGFPNEFESEKIISRDILEIVFTSGTTSDPKGVIITNENLVSNVRSLREAMPLPSNLIFLSVIPMSHLLEQTMGFICPLRFGCKIVYTQSRRSAVLSEAMRREKVTTIVGVPLLLKVLKEKIEREAEKTRSLNRLKRLRKLSKDLPIGIRRVIFRKIIRNFGDLQFFFVGAAALDPEVEEFWDSLGVLVLQGYGLTETSPIMTCNNLRNFKRGTVGKVLPDQEIKTSKDGEILCKGNNVTSGYYLNENASSSAFEKGWFKTGDIGEIDSQGFLTIKGRKKNMIKTTAGMNIYPEDIEKVVNSLQEIKDSCVVGLEEKKDIIVACIIIAKNKINSSEEINKINSKLESHQKIQKLIIWDKEDFPRTPSLKIKRQEVINSIKNGRESGFEEQENDKIHKILRQLSNVAISKIKSNSKLSTDLAIDSLHRVELVSLIEENFDITIEEEKINEKSTVQDLHDLIEKGSENKKKSTLSAFNISDIFSNIRIIAQLPILFSLEQFYQLSVKGDVNIKVPVIFAINHTSHLDSVTLLRALPIRVRKKLAFAAASDYFFEDKNKVMNFLKRYFLITLFNAYPFSRLSNARNSMKMTGYLIDKGYSVAIYPEGTRTKDGKMGNFKSGIGLLASKMEVPIVPVKIKGLFEIMPKGTIIPKQGKVELILGNEINFDKNESFLILSKKIEQEVRKL